MLRLFICIWLPKEIVEKVIKLQNDLRETGIKAKYVEKENLHVTVTFLGNVEENKINEVKMKLEDSVKSVESFYVNFEGLKIIPNENYIKVIGINVKGNEIKELIKSIGLNVGGSFHEDSKITLCRVKNVPDKKQLVKFIEDNRNVNIGSLHVKNASLVKSVITKQGPKYETIYKVKLK